LTTGDYNPDQPFDCSVADYLVDRLENRHHEVAWYLASKNIDWSQIIPAAEGIADVMIRCAEDIDAEEALGRLIEMLGPDDPENKGDPNGLFYLAIMEALEESLAQRVIRLLPRAQKRLLDLLGISKEIGASTRARDFLIRVSRSYLLSFDPECVVMCRSALEAQFDAEISNDDCIRVLKKSPKASDNSQPPFNLYDKITVARELGRITPEIGSFAHEVRKAANAVVHQKPVVRCDTTTIVKYTVAVMTRLGNYQKDAGNGTGKGK